MNISEVYKYDNNIYAFVLLGILLFILITKKDIFDYSRKLFYRMVIFNMSILAVEVLAWVFDGVSGGFAFFANYFFNVLLILMEPIMAAIWLTYVDYKIYGSLERLRRRFYYLYASMFAGMLLIINIFTPIAFQLDENNVYHRGDYLWLSLVFVFGLVLYTVVLAYKNRKELSDKMIAFIAVFAFLPVLVSFIQLFVYGLILTWAVVALGIVFAYYLIEIKGSSIDNLTDLFSRKKMEEILTGKVEQNVEFTVIMMDLEYFKKINDMYGHKVGDETLVHFSKVLQKSFGKDFLISRTGGDEFIIISKGSIEKDISVYREHFKHELMEYGNPHLKEIGVSFGAKTYPTDSNKTVDQILDDVDALMYQDKSKNKNMKRRKTD